MSSSKPCMQIDLTQLQLSCSTAAVQSLMQLHRACHARASTKVHLGCLCGKLVIAVTIDIFVYQHGCSDSSSAPASCLRLVQATCELGKNESHTAVFFCAVLGRCIAQPVFTCRLAASSIAHRSLRLRLSKVCSPTALRLRCSRWLRVAWQYVHKKKD